MLGFLSTPTGAHTHIDVCVYGILHRLKQVDVEFMKALTPFVNVVPVILKSDTMAPDEVFELKVTILEELGKNGISIYGFGLDYHELLDLARGGISGSAPFAITNKEKELAHKEDVMNEFEDLRSNILSHHLDDLRVMTAERFAEWRAYVRWMSNDSKEKLDLEQKKERERDKEVITRADSVGNQYQKKKSGFRVFKGL